MTIHVGQCCRQDNIDAYNQDNIDAYNENTGSCKNTIENFSEIARINQIRT